ncbi:hypothetical protein F4808DRAFT_313718 [Astrocystis sublimbata]|nr:hypothetical protein F4808DRAFT_313718 [Astrocystis sublimbata]
MASPNERALTCKLPSRNGATFLRFNSPDWSKIDIIGQTIILSVLTPCFGSFQRACEALKLQSNEIHSFVATHLEYQKASKRGKLIAEQWGRDRAVPADDDADIPQQRPVLVHLSSIAPACAFLEALGHVDMIPAVQASGRQHIIWPPYIDIDVTGLDTSRLDQSDVTFPAPLKERALAVCGSRLNDDSRIVAEVIAALEPKEDGSPDAQISFFRVRTRSVAFGPGGSRKLVEPGNYYLFWEVGSVPKKGHHKDFVLANTALDQPQGISSQLTLSSRPLGSPAQDADVPPERWALKANRVQGQEPVVNPKAIFGRDVKAHGLDHAGTGLLLPEVGPLNPGNNGRLINDLQAGSGCPDQFFQFRLPRGYTMLGPRGHRITFDRPDFVRYDVLGTPRGLGGTYLITSSPRFETRSQIEELPPHIPFRLGATQQMVLICNGYVLPGLVDSGVHEWSTRDGKLDLWYQNRRGRFEIEQLLPASERTQSVQNDRSRLVAKTPSAIREAVEVLKPYREWLDRQEAKTQRLEEEMAERKWAEELEAMDNDTPRRKRGADEDDDDYLPTTSRPARGRKPGSAQKARTSRKLQKQPADNVSNLGELKLTSTPKQRQTQARISEVRSGNSGPGSGGMDQPSGESGALKANDPRQSASESMPIGPLLEVVRANPAVGGDPRSALHLSPFSTASERETGLSAAQGNGAIGGNEMDPRIGAEPTISREFPSSGQDEDEDEDEMNQ